jgi:subtilisin family serine protease
VRRVMIGATCLVVFLSFTISLASPKGASFDAAKLSPELATLIANGGYGKDPLIREVVSRYRSGDIYYLVHVNGAIDRNVLRTIQASGARVRAAFPEVSWIAVVSPLRSVAVVARLARVTNLEIDGVQRLLGVNIQYLRASSASLQAWGNQTKRGTADIGAPAAWAAGIDGSGVTVGVADSGVDGTHPDLSTQDWRRWGQTGLPAKLEGFRDCQGSAGDLGLVTVGGQQIPPSLPDICNNVPSYDDNGHGTHVSGIIAGSAHGGSAAQQGLYPGMAPGAGLAVAKVCSAAGVCLNSAVMAGLEWLSMEKSQGGAGADVINVSLGSDRFVAAAPGGILGGAQLVTNNDAEDQLVNALSRAHNVLFSIAAGNSGPTLGSIGNPADASQAMAVGASIADFDLNHPTAQTAHGEFGDIAPAAAAHGAQGIAGFSSRGPSGDGLVKPDLVAPGSYVISALSKEATEVRATSAHLNNFSTDQTYAVLSGTSMAAPAGAGAAALVINAYEKAIRSAPRYYWVKAALANTAGGKAFEGPVVGLIGGILVRAGAATPEERYPTRNATYVGVTGTGAGRIDVPSATYAITHGVIAYTPGVSNVQDIHQLQPSWAAGDVAPGGSARTTFLLHGAPQMVASAPVTFGVDSGPEPAGVNAAPASWFSLPSAVALRNKDVPVTFGLHLPSTVAPGIYEATIVGTVDLGTVKEHIRLPVQLFVRVIPSLGKASLQGPIWASGVSDYTIVGLENPLASEISTDWTMIPLRLSKTTKQVTFSVYDTKGADTMDVFIFDANGNEIDSTVTNSPDHWVPNGALYTPTSRGSPATVTIRSSEFDGSTHPKLPALVWIAVSDSGPAKAPGFSTYHLDMLVS